MKPIKVILIFAILFCIAMLAIPMAQALTETQITTDPGDQTTPAVYGDTIVWADNRNGDWDSDIYMYDIATGQETRVTTDYRLQQTPAIYGDTIVWADGREYNTIYMYDISSGTESKVPIGSNNAYNPDIYGDTIVWTDSRNGNYDIYMYNLTTGVETQITDEPYIQTGPAIYGDIIVWTDNRNGAYNYDTYMYNIATGVERKVTTNPGYQYWPDIYGDIIVWSDTRNGNYDIYMYNIATGEETRVTTDPKDQSYPAIYGDKIFWEDTRSGYDIYMYDLSHPELGDQRITTDPSNQLSPAIYGDKIVWQDHRNGNWDIYMTTLTPPDTTPPVTTLSTNVSPTKGWYTGDVMVTLSATDDSAPITTYYTLDGVPGTAGTPPLSIPVTGDGEHTLTYYSEDAAGNTETARTETINIDATQPVVSISAPLDEAVYTLGQPVLADWSVTDATSGMADSSGSTESGKPIDTTTVGAKEFTVTATDNAGHTTTVTRHYTVSYAFTDNTPDTIRLTQIKKGSPLPLKIVLNDYTGNLLTTAVVELWLAPQQDTEWGDPVQAASVRNPKDSNVFSYDPSKGQYVYILDTSKLAIGTWQLQIRTGDGITQTMTIKIVK